MQERRSGRLCIKDPWRIEDLSVDKMSVPRWWEADLSLEADALILLAYEPPPTGVDRLEHELRVNAAGAERVARTAAGTVVFASSADVYGPWHEDAVTENTPPEPATPYAEAKLEAERRLSVLDCISLRIATVFGPGENGPRAIPSFVRALTAGERRSSTGTEATYATTSTSWTSQRRCSMQPSWRIRRRS